MSLSVGILGVNMVLDKDAAQIMWITILEKRGNIQQQNVIFSLQENVLWMLTRIISASGSSGCQNRFSVEISYR